MPKSDDSLFRQVVRFEVVAISDEFRELLRDLPEAIRAKEVRIGNKVIQGARTVLVASSLEQIRDQLPEIVAKLVDPEHQHLMVNQRSGECYCSERFPKCPAKKLPANCPTCECEQMDSLVTLNKSFELDISKLLSAQRSGR